MGYILISDLLWKVRRQTFDELIAVRPHRFQHNQKFDNIQPPFSQFIFTDKRCGLAQLLRELRLRQTGIFACLNKRTEQIPIRLGVNGSSQ